ncbi:NADH-quinone oxidoreductase subunit NuoE [candidate division KSB1 bacterium]
MVDSGLDQKFIDGAEALIARYPYRSAALLPVLHLLQERYGSVADEHIKPIAQLVDVPPIRVREVITFYTMFYRPGRGRYVIQVCRTLSCSLLGADNLYDHLRKKLGVDNGETTADGRFTLMKVECLGACDIAPVMQINDKTYGELTEDKIDRILEECE